MALCLQCRIETLTPSAVPTGLAILDTVPTDESVGYFHPSRWDKMPVYKKGEGSHIYSHPVVFVP